MENVDQVKLLTDGLPDAVIQAVKDCISEAGVGRGYVCSPSNMIHSEVNPDLYKVMVEAIHHYGQYPLDLDLLASSCL